MKDSEVLSHIKNLISEEQNLYENGNLGLDENKRLDNIKHELDEYWDFLRQRRALRDSGKNPGKADFRDPDTLDNYNP
ncbi:DUF2630 family protein [Pedobacter sp. 22163]|uniref:DUF2630 family protein n=1 Tax=Pedobacter sp. 22163 TaxID=3453883 RepID=UPI003F8299B8